MRKKFLVAAAVGAMAVLGLAGPAQAAPAVGTAQVSVFHGIPNTPVDVFVDHAKLLSNFKPGTFAGPLTLPAGTYTVAITGVGAINDKKPIIGPVNLTFASQGNYTIVAHLTEKGLPTATLFSNNIRNAPKGDGRIIVRHVAAAPGVDIYANGALTMKGLVNPRQSTLDLPVATYTVAVTLRNTAAPVIGPAPISIKSQTDTIVYAYGSAAQGTLSVAVQYVKLG